MSKKKSSGRHRQVRNTSAQAANANRTPALILTAGILIIAVALGAFVLSRTNATAQTPIDAAVGNVLPAEIDVIQAASMRDAGAYVVDVRDQWEWDNFHIPGTTLVPLGELPDRLAEIPRDRQIVVVCNSGRRSKEGRDILLNAGFTSVTSMAGGVTEWQSTGYETVGGD